VEGAAGPPRDRPRKAGKRCQGAIRLGITPPPSRPSTKAAPWSKPATSRQRPRASPRP